MKSVNQRVPLKITSYLQMVSTILWLVIQCDVVP